MNSKLRFEQLEARQMLSAHALRAGFSSEIVMVRRSSASPVVASLPAALSHASPVAVLSSIRAEAAQNTVLRATLSDAQMA